jgi:tetrahydromethanopterin S-methyltransferase subunit G
MSEQDYLKAIAVLADKVSKYHERLLAVERDVERHVKDPEKHCGDDCECKKS